MVSLAFSMASAYAIRLFFAPLDTVDRLEGVVTWVIALGFGVLGYFVSRGLVHRMMSGERIRVYAPICLVVGLVEIACNYTLAAEVIHRAAWLPAVPVAQRQVLMLITYGVLSVIPLVSVLLAVVDMDLERAKLKAASPQAATPAGERPQSAAQPARAQGNTATDGSPMAQRVVGKPERDPQTQQAKLAALLQTMQQQRQSQEPTTQAQIPLSAVRTGNEERAA